MSKRKIIIDTDPGYDDAIAIALASLSEKLEIIGIIAVSGNQCLEKVGKNALSLAEYLNINCPIAKGLSCPLIKEPVYSSYVHGESGLDGTEELFATNPKTKNFDSRDGVQLMIDLCLSNDKVTIVIIGPMTDLAMALRLEPKIKEHIEEVSLMGGSTDVGNTTPAAEFNFFADPEAAYIAFNSGLKIKMHGLNITSKTGVFPYIMDKFKNLNTKSSKLFTITMQKYIDNRLKAFGQTDKAVHDPVAIACLIDDDIVTYSKQYVEIDISHGPSYGRSNCYSLGKTPNALVGVNINIQKFWKVIEDAFKKY